MRETVRKALDDIGGLFGAKKESVEAPGNAGEEESFEALYNRLIDEGETASEPLNIKITGSNGEEILNLDATQLVVIVPQKEGMHMFEHGHNVVLYTGLGIARDKLEAEDPLLKDLKDVAHLSSVSSTDPLLDMLANALNVDSETIEIIRNHDCARCPIFKTCTSKNKKEG